MQLKTILNRVLRHRGFVYAAERLVETLTGPVVEVDLRARAAGAGLRHLGPAAL